MVFVTSACRCSWTSILVSDGWTVYRNVSVSLTTGCAVNNGQRF